jgi:hypothetical protein
MTPPEQPAPEEPPREPAPSVPLLVRFGGRWLCRHQLADLPSPDDPHVQLRP